MSKRKDSPEKKNRVKATNDSTMLTSKFEIRNGPATEYMKREVAKNYPNFFSNKTNKPKKVTDVAVDRTNKVPVGIFTKTEKRLVTFTYTDEVSGTYYAKTITTDNDQAIEEKEQAFRNEVLEIVKCPKCRIETIQNDSYDLRPLFTINRKLGDLFNLNRKTVRGFLEW